VRVFADSPDFTTKQQKKSGATVRHVAGPELLEVRQIRPAGIGADGDDGIFLLGIYCCEDIGHMVFNLIEAGVSKTEEDSLRILRTSTILKGFCDAVHTSETTGREISAELTAPKSV
jgi:uncharacterized repeat protein (TIGR04138 family)